MSKYICTGMFFLFKIEVISWICLALIAVYCLYDLCIAIDREKGGRF